ncbi:tRNA dihydrouridine(20/20a) synthase DusA [Roseicyclus marinus]|uniref:tRNA dihydrouridine(20/20a) synthase DusA n=1 Tax=Roseicyclus marinus TaxID=2161673 RepID=UPI002410AC93|nr:tRNA dihydrouridine(20/20a) synthase DusA [Roseicyclus marinus]MDG3040048.1 tRNA dihydrouridine(20/20a) synthase DusA [Roseicyclus marinus]
MPLNAATPAARLSVAPMMDWTDRHCRYFHRLMSRNALLYTEMVTAPAVIHGDQDRLIGFDEAEHPVALQLGGSDPGELAEASRIAAAYGYDEINLNVGCPSDRVQSGCFGAVLMERPELVAECISAMIAASPVEVTVKCRIGVDDQIPEEVLPAFLETVSAAGVTRFAIHARKAWLQGLSPKENRDIPPLDYPLVHAMKQAFPHLHLSINGGITMLEEAQVHLAAGMDGVMIGRAAYHAPAGILLSADRDIFGDSAPPRSAESVAHAMLPYIEAHLMAGGRLHQVTRHMLGLFTGRPGARGWKRYLSENAHRDGAGPEVVERALAEVTARAA